MEVQFVDRILICSDCHGEFVFTAGEQLFFHDKQFKNDPKRCKPCKSRRSGLAAAASGNGPAAAGLSRTETRTECSECGIQTTVPFKPTQGRPVLCRQCFQARNKAAAAPQSPQVAAAIAASPMIPHADKAATALTAASTAANGEAISADAAVLAVASMAAASPQSSVASVADLAAISPLAPQTADGGTRSIPAQLLQAASDHSAEHLSGVSAPEASEA